MMDEPLEFWRIFLHPSQSKLVEHTWNGPVLVRGGAGTGKTVAAMHRARWLADLLGKGNDPNGRVLFTTFTSNLAADVESDLANLCSKEQMSRIEVKHLDGWVVEFLRRAGYEKKILYAGDDARSRRSLGARDQVVRRQHRPLARIPDGRMAAGRAGEPNLRSLAISARSANPAGARRSTARPRSASGRSSPPIEPSSTRRPFPSPRTPIATRARYWPRSRRSSPTRRSWSTRRRISERRFGSSRRSLLGRATSRRRTACSSSATRISVAPSQRDPAMDSNHLRERRRAVI